MSLIGREEPFTDWGLLQLAKVQKSFKREDGLYREELGKRNPAFNWGGGVMLSALNAAAAIRTLLTLPPAQSFRLFV